MIYLDSAATSFHKPESVAKAVYEAFAQLGNAGRGAHAPTLNASRRVYETRAKIARFFQAPDPSHVIFTANVTEALNIAIEGLIEPGDHVISTVMEHNSVLRPLYRKEKEGAELTFLSADELGRIDPDQYRKAMRHNTKAIVVHHASNLTGNVQDLSEISKIAHEAGALLIVDAAQTAGCISVDMEEMGIDVLCFTGHKCLLGPQGTGGLCLGEGITIKPLLVGGSGIHSFDKEQPAELPTALEAGTLNGHGISGLKAGVSYIEEKGILPIEEEEKRLRDLFVEGIHRINQQYEKPVIRIYGDVSAPIHAPIVTINIGHMDAAVVSDLLWEDYEICTRAGAHCAPLAHQHFGTVEQGSVRFSFSFYNTKEEIETTLQVIADIAADYLEEMNLCE